MIYEYKCHQCGRRFEKQRPVAESAEPAACECGATAQRTPSLPTVTWNEIGALDPDFPSASDRWERERKHQIKREQENVANHGDGEELSHRKTW